MRYDKRRSLQFTPGEKNGKSVKHPDMTWHDHLVMLLHIGAEIEHGLMVMYLYAAYSLGGEQIPEKERDKVQRWRDSILAVAKEEMGHLLTVQNVLTLLGAPINLGRDDFPWDVDYYPFDFTLEPLTIESLSCYVFAEMPPDINTALPPGRRLPKRYEEFRTEDLGPIVERVREHCTRFRPHTVGAVYHEIIDILEHPTHIPDAAFHGDTFSIQGSSDDWGRGYQPRPRLLDAEGNVAPVATTGKLPSPSQRAPHVIIDQVATRAQAVAALRRLGAQGEAPHIGIDDKGEPSHFDRFLEIYQELDAIKGAWSPSLAVPVNPTTAKSPVAGVVGALITAERSVDWANLFNLRYRMLLAYLSHTFRLARTTRSDEPGVRAMVMHRVFGEMYNLKTIAGILVSLPFAKEKVAGLKTPTFAGPPFEMPYNLAIPPAEADVWHLHRDLLGSADKRCHAMLSHADTTHLQYLKTLLDLDTQTRAWIDQILADRGPTERKRQ